MALLRARWAAFSIRPGFCGVVGICATFCVLLWIDGLVVLLAQDSPPSSLVTFVSYHRDVSTASHGSKGGREFASYREARADD